MVKMLKVVLLGFCVLLVVPNLEAAVADVLSEIVGSQRRINDEILKTVQENIETSPILRGPETFRKIVVSGSFVPKLPNDGPLSLLKPENLSKLLPPNPFGSGDHKIPGPLGLIGTIFNPKNSNEVEITEATETTEHHVEAKVTDLLPTRPTSLKVDLPSLTKEVSSSSEENIANNLLISSTIAPIIGRTIPSISLDKKSRK